MIGYQFYSRTFSQPIGYEIPVVSSSTFLDSTINGLYTVFTATFANQLYCSYTQQLKKGCRVSISCETKYLFMAMYVLRNWYNISMSPVFNPLIPTDIAYSIIETCIGITGSPNTLNQFSLFSDKNYVSLPLAPNIVSDSIPTQIPYNQYFN